MNESPTPAPWRHINQYASSKSAWGTTLSLPLAGIWALLFAWLVPLPSWLTIVLLLIGFAAIFIGFVALGVEIDTWRKRHG